MTSASWALVISVFLAALVEMVEALTIVMAMGVTRSWRSTVLGILAAVGALVIITSIAGYALATWLPRTVLQLIIGVLLLIFGMQWLRKAALRASGRKAVHDEAAIYRTQVEAAQAAGHRSPGLDGFAFVVSFKGVLLEGLEVVFIVITFGLNAGNVPLAAAAAGAALIVVLAAAVVVRAPLSRVPENTMKSVVALLLVTFGTFWSVEGLGVFTPGHSSLTWPGADLALPVVFVAWLLVMLIAVRVLRGARQVEDVEAVTPR